MLSTSARCSTNAAFNSWIKSFAWAATVLRAPWFLKQLPAAEIVVPIHNWLKKNGVQFRNRSQVIDLLMQDGKVTGVLINCDYNWKDGTSKKEQRIGSRGGVVIATGGWGQDKDFIKTTMPVYSLLECTSQPGATAEMLKALLKSGCLLCSICIS